jgi:hypothetical protein
MIKKLHLIEKNISNTHSFIHFSNKKQQFLQKKLIVYSKIVILTIKKKQNKI